MERRISCHEYVSKLALARSSREVAKLHSEHAGCGDAACLEAAEIANMMVNRLEAWAAVPRAGQASPRFGDRVVDALKRHPAASATAVQGQVFGGRWSSRSLRQRPMWNRVATTCVIASAFALFLWKSPVIEQQRERVIADLPLIEAEMPFDAEAVAFVEQTERWLLTNSDPQDTSAFGIESFTDQSTRWLERNVLPVARSLQRVGEQGAPDAFDPAS